MKKLFSTAFEAYRRYKIAKFRSKLYRTFNLFSYSLLIVIAIYVLLLSFPQVLFAHEVSYKNFMVYSREPIDENIYAILDEVEAKLSASALKDEIHPRIFLSDSFGIYTLFANVRNKTFGITNPLLPTSNNFINKSDVARNLVFHGGTKDNQRSLSSVITHEATHLLIRKKFGYWRSFWMPKWKVQGYCEYASGGATLDYETGVSRWKENPSDDSDYDNFKYYLMVKYLLDTEKLTVNELFTKDFDAKEVEAKVFRSVS